MAELVDAQDLKSCAEQSACRFDPGSRQQASLETGRLFFTVVESVETTAGSGVFYDTTRLSAPVRIQIS